ncbi:MAG: AraC family transcriptional regulator [Anaerolineales bacterium]|nr:AraC family transcriptional regulator [Anaerolineales bacterium]
MKPNIVQKPAFRVVGLKYRGKNENGEVPQLWREFWPRHDEIPQRAPVNVSYGVIDHFDEVSGAFDYIAGVEVTDDDEVPEGMTAVDVPEQMYAVFDCTLPTLMEAIQFAYGEWLPGSGYVREEGPEFELYDERFDVSQEKYGMSIYIPVRKATA